MNSCEEASTVIVAVAGSVVELRMIGLQDFERRYVPCNISSSDVQRRHQNSKQVLS